MRRTTLRDRRQILARRWRLRRSPGPHHWTALAAAATLVVAGGAAYTVQRGDTLSGLAARFGTTVDALADANGVDDPDLIYEGQTLTIPGGKTPARPGESRTRSSTATTHVVSAGESLATIARRYGLSIEALARANGILDVNKVMAGSLLRVAGEAPPPPGVSTGSEGGGQHRIRPGETLSSIAQRYGTTVSALVDANGLASADRIIAGQRLAVPRGESGGAGWTCPIDGGQFINDFGVAKPDGRFHEGLDVFAPKGTIIRAPVPGRVEHVEGPRAGLQFVLHGRDGYTYIGTHLDSFGAAGEVAAGDPLGQVGNSGNAVGGPPHLHLEMHHGGVVNPYPTLKAHCG